MKKYKEKDGVKPFIRAIIDRQGYTWFRPIPTNYKSISRFDGSKFSILENDATPQSFYSDQRTLCDRKGMVWMGGDGGIINMWNGKINKHISTKNGLLSDSVISMREIKPIGILALTQKGISLIEYNYNDRVTTLINFDRSGLQNVTSSIQLSKNAFLQVDSLGGIWWCLNRFDSAAQVHRFKLKQGRITDNLSISVPHRIYGVKGFKNCVVISTDAGGYAITATGEQKKIADGYFFLHTDTEGRFFFGKMNQKKWNIYVDKPENIWDFGIHKTPAFYMFPEAFPPVTLIDCGKETWLLSDTAFIKIIRGNQLLKWKDTYRNFSDFNNFNINVFGNLCWYFPTHTAEAYQVSFESHTEIIDFGKSLENVNGENCLGFDKQHNILYFTISNSDNTMDIAYLLDNKIQKIPVPFTNEFALFHDNTIWVKGKTKKDGKQKKFLSAIREGKVIFTVPCRDSVDMDFDNNGGCYILNTNSTFSYVKDGNVKEFPFKATSKIYHLYVIDGKVLIDTESDLFLYRDHFLTSILKKNDEHLFFLKHQIYSIAPNGKISWYEKGEWKTLGAYANRNMENMERVWDKESDKLFFYERLPNDLINGLYTLDHNGVRFIPTPDPIYWKAGNSGKILTTGDELIIFSGTSIYRCEKGKDKFSFLMDVGDAMGYIWNGMLDGNKLYISGWGKKAVIINLEFNHSYTPPLSFQHIFVNEAEWDIGDSADLNYDEKIEFKFLAIEKFLQDKIEYQIRMKNLQKDWSAASKQQQAEFYSLPAGNYYFEARARGESGIWGEPVGITVIVHPPWFRNWIAYSAYTVLFFLFVYTLVRWRSRSLKKQKIKLERIIEERTSELLTEKNNAQRLAKVKEDFLSNMSHEIRTPLNAIAGYTDLSLKESSAIKIKTHLKSVKVSSDHLRRLVDDILNISKMESGNYTFFKTDFDISEIAEAINHQLQFQSLKKGNVLTISIDNPSGTWLFGDKDKLLQVLLNLLDNAIKFTENGKIDVFIRVIQMEENVHVAFKVKDTGIGIPQNKLITIFESFTQADNTITRKYGGTGLGLTISKKLIELQEGQIQIESEEGKGSVFSFFIPYKSGKKQVRAEEKISFSTNPLKGLYFLVAEDDSVNQELLRSILSQWEVKTDFASDAEMLLSMLQLKDYQLLLMDIHMPGMSGYEASLKIRSAQEERIRNIPIIALTADVLNSTKELIAQSGITDCLYKPIDSGLLHSKIISTLGLKMESVYISNSSSSLKLNTTKISLDYFITNCGTDQRQFLKMLSSTSEKLMEYNISLALASEEYHYEEMNFIVHKMETLIKMLGIENLMPILEQVKHHASNKENNIRMKEEIKSVDSIIQESVAELHLVMKTISKN